MLLRYVTTLCCTPLKAGDKRLHRGQILGKKGSEYLLVGAEYSKYKFKII
jgi:hypothetical protein